MTPKRKQWWDSLSSNEKYLRIEASRLKCRRSEEKLRARNTWSITIRRVAIMRINHYTAHIRALKHELDHTAVYTEHYEGETSMCLCEKCGGTFEDFGQRYCCWCGRKIKEWKE